MKRRARGEGSIYQRKDGRWCATFSYDADGIPKRKTVYGKTQAEALSKHRKFKAMVEAGMIPDSRSMTLGQFLIRWLEESVRTTNRRTTYVTYRTIIKAHVLPHVGALPLRLLAPMRLQALYATLQDKKCSPRMVQIVHARLHTALEQAVRWGLLARNPCDAVTVPRSPKPKMQALDEAEVRRLLIQARQDPLYALYLLAIATGLRQGELLALQWKDIDLRAESLSVRHTLQDINGHLELTEPKTSGSRRKVDLPTLAVEALRAHRMQLMSNGKLSDFVFSDSEGKPLRKSNLIRRSFKPLLRAASLPNIRFHDLRHTAATLMFTQGINPKVIQERLGHASIMLTLDTYSHVLPTMQREAADRLNTVLAKM